MEIKKFVYIFISI
uniref:Uncharacterized protein n=1 Tax=Rhizophora mucronata TaxID=61149 RepID=A0A2P2R2Y5_RHIMU